MAGYSGRRGAEGLAAPKGGARPIFRNCTKISDQNIQLCNRTGCSGGLSSTKPSSSCSTPGNKMTVAPSKVVSKVSKSVKPLRGLRKSSSSVTVSSARCGESISGMQEKVKVVTSKPSPPARVDQTESLSGQSSFLEISSPSEQPSIKPQRTFLKKPASVVGSNLTSSRGSGVSKCNPQLSRSNTLTARRSSVYVRCNSVPVVAASDSASNSRKQMLKKRSPEGESSSSSRVKQQTIAENTRIPSLRNGISISETREAQRSQRGFINNGNALVRARRSDSSSSCHPPQMLLGKTPVGQSMHRLPYSLSATGHPQTARCFARPNTTESSRSRNLSSPPVVASPSTMMDHEGFRHYNINGITEVLLALEQIEHDREISYEQLLALESNAFLNGLSFHDQYRDMRLDIDDMSYEELLALEERMGSVSTALTEEALEKSISKCVYKPMSFEASFSETNEDQDDMKCSICQEEYDNGDEMGRLKCKHSFHVECIDQWLRQKNWCPMCKSSVASSPS